jgi:hypothetical protein
MIELITALGPTLIEALTENKEVVEIANQNKEIVSGLIGAILIDWCLRLFPTKEHKSIVKVAIAILEPLLAGMKRVDEKLALKKK